MISTAGKETNLCCPLCAVVKDVNQGLYSGASLVTFMTKQPLFSESAYSNSNVRLSFFMCHIMQLF